MNPSPPLSPKAFFCPVERHEFLSLVSPDFFSPRYPLLPFPPIVYFLVLNLAPSAFSFVKIKHAPPSSSTSPTTRSFFAFWLSQVNSLFFFLVLVPTHIDLFAFFSRPAPVVFFFSGLPWNHFSPSVMPSGPPSYPLYLFTTVIPFSKMLGGYVPFSTSLKT